MAIQAQVSAGFVFGGCQDLLAENAFAYNNLCINNHQSVSIHEPPVQKVPKIVDDCHLSISQIISAQIQNENADIECYMNSQNERLIRMLQEYQKRETLLLLKRYGSKIRSVMQQKEAEIERATRKNSELHECARRIEMERQAWQRIAQENEATAASLSATIERVREAAAASSWPAEDAESWCEEREAETCGRGKRERVCRCCKYRESCVIMLPCKHLCSCRDCDAFLDCCPVCNQPKKASLEALL